MQTIIFFILACTIAGLIIFIVLNKKNSATEATSLAALQKECEAQKIAAVRAEERSANLEGTLHDVRAELEQKSRRLIELTEALAQSKEREATSLKTLADREKMLTEISIKSKLEFENLANKIFSEKSKEFTTTGETTLKGVLNPLSQKIAEFNKMMQETNEKAVIGRTELKTQLETMKNLNLSLQTEAKDLTLAIKGDTQKQGRWGEVILEKILESSGLEKGREFKTQDSFTLDTNKKLRPDAVVYLPGGKTIIIDSKVSLTAYERFTSAKSEEDREVAIKEHIDSLKAHIKELSDKDYAHSLGLETPEYTLMFVPVESSFSVAVQREQKLFLDAWEKRIIIVSPSTLIATLMTVASVWKQEKQRENAQNIAKKGADLYEKLCGFVSDMEDLGKKLNAADTTYHTAMKKFSEGSGNAIRQAEMLKELGIKTSKDLPKILGA
ncbi:MAG: DNA recombination protein RmuC [Fibrobacteraceae bacterium]|nr:DNA recombination protein RmuC [Fibrobacteraceae bacterium]